MRAPLILLFVLAAATSGMLVAPFDSLTLAQGRQSPAPNPGRAAFERACARCHGADGQGGDEDQSEEIPHPPMISESGPGQSAMAQSRA